MEFINIKENCFYFKHAVNMGYIVSPDRKYGMLIDAGLEAAAAKKAVAVLAQQNLPITHLFITHAHADHFGGAQYIQKNFEVHTIAPSIEEAIMRNSVLEPIYLFHGNWPLKEMRNKFLEAPSIIVDEICQAGKWPLSTGYVEFIHLPGHSYNQFGLIYNGICYAADAFLGREVLQKHKIPFIVDAAANFDTLEVLLNKNVEGMVPGHGNYSTHYPETIQANLDVHRILASQIYNLILARGNRGLSIEDLIAEVLNKYDIQPANLGMYSLFRTAITAYLILFMEEGKTGYTFLEGRPIIHAVDSLA
jgi:glyoxylase-like metal-dependent hydrolase (beta-lactamase superfamily II)